MKVTRLLWFFIALNISAVALNVYIGFSMGRLLNLAVAGFNLFAIGACAYAILIKRRDRWN